MGSRALEAFTTTLGWTSGAQGGRRVKPGLSESSTKTVIALPAALEVLSHSCMALSPGVGSWPGSSIGDAVGSPTHAEPGEVVCGACMGDPSWLMAVTGSTVCAQVNVGKQTAGGGTNVGASACCLISSSWSCKTCRSRFRPATAKKHREQLTKVEDKCDPFTRNISDGKSASSSQNIAHFQWQCCACKQSS